MIPRIKSIIDRNEYKLEVLFDDGKCVLYDAEAKSCRDVKIN